MADRDKGLGGGPYVFLKEMPFSLKVVKPILMNFEHSEMSNFYVAH